MSFELIPGNALGCRTNAHRHGWNGKICERASTWSCGIDQEFREKYCENGVPRCFHLHIFDEDDPYLVIPDSGVGWILEADPHAFDDQILLVWAPDSEEPHGTVAGKPSASLMAGAYRIEGAERLEHRNHVEWQIRPHPDGWTFLGTLGIQAPRFIHLDGPYIKQVEHAQVERLFEVATEAGAEIDEDWTQEDKDRLAHFVAHIEEWFAVARERAPQPRSRSILLPARRGGPVADSEGEGRDRNGHSEAQVELVAPAIPPAAPAPMDQPSVLVPLLDEAKKKPISDLYGESVLTALIVGSMTKPIVVLRGEPGVGKSRLAVELIEDLSRERTLVVPVDPSWRGREDLFGRVHPSKNLFEPSELATFLHRAQLAWDAGDHRTRVVVFDDFDLSPPELWLSEILARSRFPAECRRDRTIEFGGHSVRGWERGAPSSIYLAPSVRFVGTVDLERSNRPLSLRVLDRSAVVNLTLDPRTALDRTGVKLTPKQVEAVCELSEITRAENASFSLRAAQALKACFGELEALGLDSWGALDHVLRQELLAKLDLEPSGARRRQLVDALAEWSAKYGAKLGECARTVDGWKQSLEAPAPVRPL